MTIEERREAFHRALIKDAVAHLQTPEVQASIPHLTDGLIRYLEDRVETGGFLRACLENNFSAAITHAHANVTAAQLKTLVTVLEASFPHNSWGSPISVRCWLYKDDTSKTKGGEDLTSHAD